MNRICFCFAILAATAQSFAGAFVVHDKRPTRSALRMAVDMPPAVIPIVTSTIATSGGISTTSSISDGINRYLDTSDSALRSSSTAVSLKERKVPTADEVAAKKRNFNVVFWGGGFVAPFLATFFYFGFKFWEK